MNGIQKWPNNTAISSPTKNIPTASLYYDTEQRKKPFMDFSFVSFNDTYVFRICTVYVTAFPTRYADVVAQNTSKSHTKLLANFAVFPTPHTHTHTQNAETKKCHFSLVASVRARYQLFESKYFRFHDSCRFSPKNLNNKKKNSKHTEMSARKRIIHLHYVCVCAVQWYWSE